MTFEERSYRRMMKTKGLVSFEVVSGETDLFISAESDLKAAVEKAVSECRGKLEEFITANPGFAESFEPVDVPSESPEIIRSMADAAKAACVGPMAAVAGAVAEYVGRALLPVSRDVIVENGGDIFMAATEPRRLAIYAGDSPLSEKIGLIIKPEQTPLGVCTSSGTVGHSVSLGKADAAVTVAKDTALADAWATRLGNLVKGLEDLPTAIEAAKNTAGLSGALLIIGDKLAVWGDLELEGL